MFFCTFGLVFNRASINFYWKNQGMDNSFNFPKAEHLCGEIRIGKLFAEGKAFIVFPLRVVYFTTEHKDKIPVKVLVGVPKKRFKRAVKRNRLKRLMREAYRLNKILLIDKCTEKNMHLDIAFNYVSDDEMDFATIQSKMKIALHRIADKIE